MDIKTVLGSAVASGAVVALTVPAMVNFVTLQATTPGTPETGHLNITGTAVSGKVRVGTSVTGGALLRVEDTATAGGIYSKSGGNGVYSESTGLTGSLIGGQFIARSTTGRGVIGSATATSGNTRGGIFDTKSTTGVGVYGLSSALSGSGVGVYGAATASSGVAVVASNPNAAQRVELAGPNGSVYTQGGLPKHEYATGVNATPGAIAYGFIGQTGTIIHVGSGNWTVTKDGTGEYTLDIQGITLSNVNECSLVAIPFDGGNAQVVTLKQPTAGGDAGLIIWQGTDGTTKVDSDFSFVVYRGAGLGTAGVPPAGLGNPAGLKRYGNTETWSKRDPKGFEEWRRRFEAWQREQLSARKGLEVTGP